LIKTLLHSVWLVSYVTKASDNWKKVYVHVNIIPGRNCRPRTQTWRPSLPDWPSEAGLHDGEEAEGGASASARKRNCKSWGRNNRIMQESKILFSYILC